MTVEAPHGGTAGHAQRALRLIVFDFWGAQRQSISTFIGPKPKDKLRSIYFAAGGDAGY